MKHWMIRHSKKWVLMPFIPVLIVFLLFSSFRLSFFSLQEEIKLHGIEGEATSEFSSPNPYPDVIFIIPVSGEGNKDIEQQEDGKEPVYYQRMTDPPSTDEVSRFGLRKDGRKYVLEVFKASSVGPHMILHSDYSPTRGYQNHIEWKLVK